MNYHLKGRSQLLVECFIAKMNNPLQRLPVMPTIPPGPSRELRSRLILEEALETVRAMGVEVFFEPQPTNVHRRILSTQDLKFTTLEDKHVNLIEVADGCSDIDVVTQGTASVFGIAHRQIFLEVMRNNHMKFAPGHSVDQYGKLIKPPNHQPPNVAHLLLEQGWKPGPGEYPKERL